MFLPETPYQPFIWGRKQQIPAPFKKYQCPLSSPIFQIKEESCQGHARDGRAGEVTEGPGSRPRPAARAPARAARPSRRAASASRLVPQLLGHPLGLLLRRPRCLCRAARFTPEKPHGRPCLFTGNDQSGGRRGVEASTLSGTLRASNLDSKQHSGLSRPRVFGNRGAFPGWQVRSRGRLPSGPCPSRLGNLVTWKVGPLLPVWVEAGGTGCGGWRNQNPRRRETGFLFGGRPAAGACGWEEEKCQLPLFVLKQRQKGGASPQPCLQMQVTCVPEDVLGGHQRRWQPRADGANHRVIV